MMAISISLFIAVMVKITVLMILSIALIKKWIAQERKYFTDFPFLMAIGFILFAITKMIDIYLYEQYGSTEDLLKYYNFEGVYIARWRFSLGVLSVFPVMLLMLIIWFEDRKKVQIFIGVGWLIISFISLFSSQNLEQFLFVSQIYSFPPLLFSSITYFIIHKQRKIPSINSLLLGIGWSCFMIVQLFRPVFYNDVYDLKWVAELIETGFMIVIGIGFFKPAFYFKNSKTNTLQRSYQLDEIESVQNNKMDKKKNHSNTSDIMEIELIH